MYTLTISDQTDHTETGPLAHYNSINFLANILLYNEIIVKYNNGISTILQQCLSDKQSIHFMPIAISDKAKYINRVSTYILHISGYLINE